MASADKVPMLQEGHRKLNDELRRLRNEERPAIGGLRRALLRFLGEHLGFGLAPERGLLQPPHDSLRQVQVLMRRLTSHGPLLSGRKYHYPARRPRWPQFETCTSSER